MGSLVEWKWCRYMVVEADIHLRLLHKSELDISKVIYNMFELLVYCLTDNWEHPYTIIQAKLLSIASHICLDGKVVTNL
jgi:hypothetical protein